MARDAQRGKYPVLIGAGVILAALLVGLISYGPAGLKGSLTSTG
jgi:hypothetical protein